MLEYLHVLTFFSWIPTGSVSQLAERSRACSSLALGTLWGHVPALWLHTVSRFHLVKDRRRADSRGLVIPDSLQHCHFYRCRSLGCPEAWRVAQDRIRPSSCVFGSDSLGLRAGNLEVQQRYGATQCQACADFRGRIPKSANLQEFFWQYRCEE